MLSQVLWPIMDFHKLYPNHKYPVRYLKQQVFSVSMFLMMTPGEAVLHFEHTATQNEIPMSLLYVMETRDCHPRITWVTH